MELVVERVAGLDVHKASVTACVRVPGAGRHREEHTETFPTTVPGLLALADWLAGARRHAGRDGGHRRLLEAGLGDPRGPLRVPARQRPSRQAGPRPQDRRL